MDINSMRSFYNSIWTFNTPNFIIDEPSNIVVNDKILSFLFNKFGFEFTQIDSNLFMALENNNHHIIKANDDGSFDYTMYKRIERHDDSCTYVKNRTNVIR